MLTGSACSFDSGRFDDRKCTGDNECAVGSACVDGYCTAGCYDRDGDGVYFGPTCTGAIDCNDGDPLRSPQLQEGPAGAASCSDGRDNDCDDQADDADSGCAPCTSDAQCDDHDPCNGVEACDLGRCTDPPDVVCNDGLDCTADSCNPANGQCEADLMPAFCLIAGTCYANGEPDPGNACRECNTAIRSDDFINDVSNVCNDGLACTHTDVCTTGTCTGTPYTCDDGFTCTVDACDGTGGCTNSIIDNFCLIDGACWARGALRPSFPCQECNPDVSKTAWSNDDTNACGDGVCERCASGACAPVGSGTAGFGCLPDANACTNDVCDGSGNCIHPAAAEGDPCGDGVCDQCQGGSCLPTGNGLAGPGCADEPNPCTDDVCNGSGGCAHRGDATNTCGDGVCEFCTAGGVCMNTGPGVLANGCAADTNDCTDDYCDGSGACVHPNDDTNSCRDGVCEHCAAGTCVSTANLVLADGCTSDSNPCTDDYCNGGGTCVHPTDNSNACSDGHSCTSDACSSGACISTPMDTSCTPGQVCAPACFSASASGCGAPPTVSVNCPATINSATPGTCTVNVGLTGQLPCLSCGSRLGMTLLSYDTFAACSLGTWAKAPGSANPICPLNFTNLPMGDGNALEAENSTVSIQRTFNTTNMNNVRLCFDYSARIPDTTETMAVSLDTGAGYVQRWFDDNGPTIASDANDVTFIPTCLDLDALDAGSINNANLGVRITFSASGSGQGNKVVLDNVSVYGWQSSFVSFPAAVFTDDFSNGALCDRTNWSLISAIPYDPICPVNFVGPMFGTLAMECRGPAASTYHDFTLETHVNASSLCDDVRIGFSHGNANEVHGGDFMHVFYDVGAGFQEMWLSEATVGPVNAFMPFQSCSQGTRIGCAPSVSLQNEAAAFNPSLGVRFRLNMNSPDRALLLDDVQVTGAACASGDAYLSIGTLSESGGGAYSFTVQSPGQTTAHMLCTWNGGTRLGRDKIRFNP